MFIYLFICFCICWYVFLYIILWIFLFIYTCVSIIYIFPYLFVYLLTYICHCALLNQMGLAHTCLHAALGRIVPSIICCIAFESVRSYVVSPSCLHAGPRRRASAPSLHSLLAADIALRVVAHVTELALTLEVAAAEALPTWGPMLAGTPWVLELEFLARIATPVPPDVMVKNIHNNDLYVYIYTYIHTNEHT